MRVAAARDRKAQQGLCSGLSRKKPLSPASKATSIFFREVVAKHGVYEEMTKAGVDASAEERDTTHPKDSPRHAEPHLMSRRV